MKYRILFLGCEAEREVERYFECSFDVYWKNEGEISEEEKKEYKYIINLGPKKEMDVDIISFQSIQECRYTPILKWLFEKGFRISGEKANALLECYVLQENYCCGVYDFWILYEAVLELESFSKKVELWDPEYRLYEDFKQRLLEELDEIVLWK